MMRDGLHIAPRFTTVAARTGWTCGICHHPILPSVDPDGPDGPCIDHILPRALGGTDAIENLRLAHRCCNEERGHRLTRAERSQLRDLGRIIPFRTAA